MTAWKHTLPAVPAAGPGDHLRCAEADLRTLWRRHTPKPPRPLLLTDAEADAYTEALLADRPHHRPENAQQGTTDATKPEPAPGDQTGTETAASHAHDTPSGHP